MGKSYISGFAIMLPNCSSRLSPPTRTVVLKSVPLLISLTTFNVCRANSLLGAKTIALAPTSRLKLVRRRKTTHLCRMDFQFLDHGKDKTGCLSRARSGHADNIPTVHDCRDRLSLNWRRILVPLPCNGFHKHRPKPCH